jgi:GNAT superfamily N-acetyltransferase
MTPRWGVFDAMDTIELIQAQLALECIGLNQDGLLIRVPGSNPDNIARVYVFQDEENYFLYFRHDLSSSIRGRIGALGPEVVFRNYEAVKALLAEDGPCTEMFVGRTYILSDPLDSRQFPDVVRLTEAHRPLIEAYHAGMDVTDRAVYAIIRDEMIASTCASARENEQAGEAYVYTVPEYRGRGYGRQVTAAWAYHLQEQGKIAFYSHAWDNRASRAVAQSLELQPCYACVNYS